jgi:hypothetical protein
MYLIFQNIDYCFENQRNSVSFVELQKDIDRDLEDITKIIKNTYLSENQIDDYVGSAEGAYGDRVIYFTTFKIIFRNDTLEKIMYNDNYNNIHAF